MEEKIENVNLECFVVPNHASPFSEFMESQRPRMIRKLELLGIPAPKINEPMVQVWITDVGFKVDNCTDHGYHDRICEALGITDHYDQFAPSFLPASAVCDATEDSVKSWTAPNGMRVNITFTQLPYRYWRFGRFEDAVAHVLR